MKHILLCASALLLAGCGADLSYKMGGNVDQLRLDKQACGGIESPTYESCMQAKGWGTVDIGLKRAAVTEDEEEDYTADDASPVTANGTGSDTGIGTAVTPVAPAGKQATKEDPRGLANAKPAPRPRAQRDPNARVSVNSWWKPGGSNAHDAIAACVAELGESHKPDYTKQTASQGLINCMGRSGWYAL